MLFFPAPQNEQRNDIPQRAPFIILSGILTASLLSHLELETHPTRAALNVMILTDIAIEISARMQTIVDQGFNYLTQNGL